MQCRDAVHAAKMQFIYMNPQQTSLLKWTWLCNATYERCISGGSMFDCFVFSHTTRYSLVKVACY